MLTAPSQVATCPEEYSKGKSGSALDEKDEESMLPGPAWEGQLKLTSCDNSTVGGSVEFPKPSTSEVSQPLTFFSSLSACKDTELLEDEEAAKPLVLEVCPPTVVSFSCAGDSIPRKQDSSQWRNLFTLFPSLLSGDDTDLVSPGTSNYYSNTTGFSTTSSNAQFLKAVVAGDAEPDGRILIPNLKLFTFSELKSAARNFGPDFLLGEGGFGKVYKGWVDEKTLAPSRRDSGIPGIPRFNPFLGRSDSKSPLELPEDYNAKIAYFGLARLGTSGGESHVMTRVMGTYGYAAPEYLATGHLSTKSDVYGFGVVLLELLTGRQALDMMQRSGQHLVEWARPFLNEGKKLKIIIDPWIEGQFSFKAILQTAELTQKCLAKEPRDRPSMKEVVKALERTEAMTELPKEKKVRSASHP
ncbi:hypothetical protein CRG98_016501 [Punica granatum]|uniref:Protein kinase domain-containing protein n=1 Tax=Punica granatum TaxID=22663 RepID=A0A2I0K3H2_PUNGR|nr:hypothetical protein CRG98_016501 [Punica granatum]